VVAGRMAALTKESIELALDLIDGGRYDAEKAERVKALETKIDHYEDRLGTYMVKLAHKRLSKVDSSMISMLLHAISDFERISDHAENILDSAQEMHDKKLSFSPKAAAELHVFASAVRDIVSRTVDSFIHENIAAARTVEPLEECIDELNASIKSRHIDRLTAGECTIELGFILQDISTNFERVSDHCSNIAIYQIQLPEDAHDTHEFMQQLGAEELAAFDRAELAFAEKYALPM